METKQEGTMIELLKSRASAQVSRYPQYAGHFDGYVLVTVTRTIRTKLGLAFQEGDVAIASPTVENSEVFVRGGGTKIKAFRTVWSLRNGCDTSVPASAVRS